jgi:predicted transcriptional regulator
VDFSVEVIAFAVEVRIVFDDEVDEEVPVRPTPWSSWSTIGKAHLRACVDTRRNLQRERLRLGHPSVTSTSVAWVSDDLAGSLASKARRSSHHLAEQALSDPTNLTRSPTLAAALWRRAKARATALAVIAVDWEGDLQRSLNTEARFSQADADADLCVVAELWSTTHPSGSTAHPTEECLEEVAKTRVEATSTALSTGRGVDAKTVVVSPSIGI